jgi:hypothetical protein
MGIAWMTDKNWLKQHLPDATESEIESFCERVGIILDNPDIREAAARQAALQAICEARRNKR